MATSALMLSGSLLVLAACAKDDADASCSCSPPGFFVAAPKGEVASIASSGVGCDGAKINCTDRAEGADSFVAGCENYSILPAAAGECRIRITTTDGRVQDESRLVEDRRGQSCCGGLYPSPESAWKIDVASK